MPETSVEARFELEPVELFDLSTHAPMDCMQCR